MPDQGVEACVAGLGSGFYEKQGACGVLRSPMDLWNEKIAAYGAFVGRADVPARVIHFERFVVDPVAEVWGMLADFDIPSTQIQAVGPTKDDGLVLVDIAAYCKQED